MEIMYNASEHYEGWLIENIVINHLKLKVMLDVEKQKGVSFCFFIRKK